METNSYTWNIISSSEEQRSKKLQVLEEEFSKSYWWLECIISRVHLQLSDKV